MAITPEQALGDKRQVEATRVKEFEDKCDAALRKNYDGRGGVTIGVQGVSQFVYNEVIARFESKGWDVKYTSDQRDGDFITFKPKQVDAESYYNK